MNDMIKRIKGTFITIGSLLFLLLTVGISQEVKAQDERPNVLLILADDLGYSDLGSYGGEINTPNLDQLAQKGIRFTQMYNSARCSPSRASLLTGLYPHQSGIGFFAGDRPQNPQGYRGKIQDNAVTVAEVLQQSGYRTFMTGKWHVSDPVPTQQGFEEFYGFTHGYASNSWEPEMMVRLPEGRPQPTFKEGEFFDSDAFTDFAMKFIKQSEEDTPDKPWFTYVSYHAPHFPIQAPEKFINKYKNKYVDGWDEIREERLARMKRMGIIPKDTELSPRSSIPKPKIAKQHGVPGGLERNPAWSEIPEDRQKDLARRMAVYAGMVDNMDYNIGRMIDYLEESGELENTIILFASDNGACAEWGPYGFDLNDQILAANEQRGHGIGAGTPGLPSKLYKGEELDKMGGPGTGIAYGSGWANVSNTPWSEYKHYAYEGGIGTPFIVHWPKGIKKDQQGSLRHQPSFMFDITATIVDITGAEYPEEYKGTKIIPMEGRSLMPIIEGREVDARPLVFEHTGNAAVRNGKWKLVGKNVLNNKGMAENPQWRLYNIEKDRSEIYDLSQDYPEVVQKMRKLFIKEANRTYILPRPGQKSVKKEKPTDIEAGK